MSCRVSRGNVSSPSTGAPRRVPHAAAPAGPPDRRRGVGVDASRRPLAGRAARVGQAAVGAATLVGPTRSAGGAGRVAGRGSRQESRVRPRAEPAEGRAAGDI